MNFFVKLSQNKKVIVPVVVVIGLSIFGGGYFINDSQQVAKQAKEDEQTQTEVKQDDFAQIEPVEKTEEEVKPAETDDPDKSVSSDEQSDKKDQTEYEEPEMEVEYKGMTVIARVETDRAGKCYIAYKANDDNLNTAVVSIKDGVCTFEDVRTGGNITVKFISDDSSQKAVKTID